MDLQFIPQAGKGLFLQPGNVHLRDAQQRGDFTLTPRFQIPQADNATELHGKAGKGLRHRDPRLHPGQPKVHLARQLLQAGGRVLLEMRVVFRERMGQFSQGDEVQNLIIRDGECHGNLRGRRVAPHNRK